MLIIDVLIVEVVGTRAKTKEGVRDSWEEPQ